jgi:putative ABC transport system permease protein
MSEIILLALDSVRRNKLRSFLTVLGVVIGVATVIGMSSIINGLNGNVSAQIEELGSNLIFISRFPPTMNGRLPPEVINRKRLTLDDAQAIAQVPLVQAVAPILRYFAVSSNSKAFTVRYRDRTAKNTIIEGVTPEQETVMNLQVSAGRWINDSDDRHSSQVVVLGHDTAETIFPVNVDPVGKEVEIEGNVFRVIGVMEKRKDALLPGNNPNDNTAAMPTKTFWRLHPEQQDFFFVVKPISQQAMPRAVSQIEEVLRKRRGVAPNKDSDFNIFTQDSFTDLWNQISRGIFTVMLGISSIALLVGGVGVMNIMLVSVTERTREIGIRKAIGATRRDILTQFLFEAVTLTAIGGVLGIVAGGAVTALIRVLAPFLPATMSLLWVSLGFTTSVGTGLIFGIYPAYKAAVLDPIEALRYE